MATVTRPALRRAAPLPLALLAALALAGPVLADVDLVASDPAAGAVLAAPPPTVTLTFDGDLVADRSGFELVGPGGSVGRGTATGTRTLALATPDLPPGAYEVRWTAGATDGHLGRGTFAFTVAEPTPAPATPTPAATDAPTAPPAVTPAPTAAASPAPEPAAAGGGLDQLLPIVVLAALGAAGGYALARRGRAR